MRAGFVAIGSSAALIGACVRIAVAVTKRSSMAWPLIFVDGAAVAMLFFLWAVAMVLAVPHWRPSRRPIALAVASFLSLPALVVTLFGWPI